MNMQGDDFEVPLRFNHLKRYVIDTRHYKFKKLSEEFVAVASEGR